MGIAAFPLYRNQRLLDEVKDGLQTRHGDDANVFWKQRAKALLNQLHLSGVEEEAAKNEVRQLLYAALGQMQEASAGMPA